MSQKCWSEVVKHSASFSASAINSTDDKSSRKTNSYGRNQNFKAGKKADSNDNCSSSLTKGANNRNSKQSETKILQAPEPQKSSLFDFIVPSRQSVKKSKADTVKDGSSVVSKNVSAIKSGNALDSSAPLIRRRKERQKPKTKRPTQLKKIIKMNRNKNKR